MTGLPQGWTETALGDVCELLNGRAYSRPELLSEGKYPVLRVGNLFSRNAWYHSDLELDPDKYIDSGDLIYAWSASFGPRIWQGGKVIYHYHIWKCALQDQAVDKHFLYNLLLWDTAKIKGDHGVGSTMMHVTKSAMEKRQIPIPPLPEQRRIVRKLDTLSARSTTARTHLTAIEKLVERYRTAVLEAAFRAAWEAGCDTTIAGCLEHAETGLVRSKAEQTPDDGYPYIRMNHYDLAGRWNDRDLTYVAATRSEFDRYQLRANDLLFNTRNSAELVGKVAIWPAGKEGYLFNNNLLRMRFSPDVVPAFAFWQMSSPPFRRYIEGFISATTSVAAIYQRSLMAAPFWVPDTDEQREIVRRIETAFAKIDRLKAEAAKALKLLGHLDQRILAKAFAGDLVPQDPTDEPAETLLARIREARAAAPKSRRGRK